MPDKSYEILIKRIAGGATTLKGFPYLVSGMRQTVHDGEMINPITKKLYVTIADEYQVSPKSVERDLRTVIHRCWHEGDQDLIRKIAGYNMIHSPTTKLFFKILADYLRENDDGESSG